MSNEYVAFFIGLSDNQILLLLLLLFFFWLGDIENKWNLAMNEETLLSVSCTYIVTTNAAKEEHCQRTRATRT